MDLVDDRPVHVHVNVNVNKKAKGPIFSKYNGNAAAVADFYRLAYKNRARARGATPLSAKADR